MDVGSNTVLAYGRVTPVFPLNGFTVKNSELVKFH
jgi:hypothetical protein